MVFDPAVLANSGVTHAVVGAAHAGFGSSHVANHDVETTRRQDAVASQDIEITRARVLWQVADRASVRHRTRSGQQLAGEHLGQRGLAGAVAADEADAVALRYSERHGVE